MHWATSSGGPGLRTAAYLASLVEPDAASQLPAFIRPLPAKISDDDVDYLVRKRALTLPSIPLQNALLRAYVEYVHPYMPLLELHDFLAAVNSRDGLGGQVSLLLYQAVMFAAVAFVDIQHLRDAGFPNRKAARKALYKRARLLYDFDYESDRLIIIQSLLLMSYWYETPDDQKDTWHWIGVAISLAHTIGLHRNPCNANMSPRKQKLWKRIWWSGFMRDRLIALGMRRPMRVQDDEFDVPMLEESDFDTDPLPDDVTVIGPECTIMRDSNAQRELAQMCVAKARLCVLVGHMLRAQYSVLMRDKARPDNTVNSTMMLFPHRKLDNYENVNLCDLKLLAWADSLPASCEYRPITPEDISSGLGTVALQRTLLHMVFHTTISALHRPQIQPVGPTRASQPVSQIQEMARRRVRDAAMHITRMCAELHQMRLDRYLPTTGVTVVLPALITHLVDIKNSDAQIRERAARGFRLCLKVMERMRDAYTAADYASIFVNEALRKATGVELNGNGAVRSLTPGTALGWKVLQAQQQRLAASSPTPPPLESNMSYTASAETQIYQNRGRMQHNQQPQGQPQPTVQQPQQQQQQMPSPYLGQRHPTPMPATAAPNLSVSTSTTEFVVPPAPTLHPHRINATNSPPPLSDNKDFDSAVGLTPTGTGSEMGSGSGSSHSGGIDQDGGLHYHNGHGQPGAYNSYHSANTANSNALLLNFELDLPGDFIDADFGNDVVGFASGSGGHMQMDMDIMSGTIGDGGANGTGGGSNGTDAATAAAAAATANALLFDWDAPSSALDFDQWLQFPPTDANNATGVNTVGSGTNGANPLGPGHVQHRDGMQGDEEMQQPQRRTVKAEHEELDENDADAQFIRALLREAPSSNIGDNKGTGATEQPKEGPARDWRMQDESLMTAIAEAVKSANQAEDTKMTVADDHDNRKRASVADAADKGLVVAGDGMQGVEMDADSDAMRMLVLAPGLD